jgi:queuosine precursor transporter
VIVAILVGALLSWVVTLNRDLAVASALAFLFGELANSIDSILFLQIAFGGLDFIEGQIIGKLWTTVFAVVLLLAVRRWVILRYSRPADEPTVPEIA